MGFAMVNVVLAVIQFLNFVYDVITLPIYFLAQRPWKVRRKYRAVKAVKVRESGGNEVVYRSVLPTSTELVKLLEENQVDTLYQLFDFMTNDPKRKDRDAFGTRSVVRMEAEEDPATGKSMTKLVLGEYSWITNKVAGRRSTDFGRGLLEIGAAAGSKVAIYADTRADWLMAVRGCFRNSMAIVTLYTNLGIDAVQYGIDQTRAGVVITSQELLPKLCAALPDLTEVFAVVVLEEPWRGKLAASVADINPKVEHEVRLIGFREVLALGADCSHEAVPPKPSDPAVIMFTSGSTGAPKGVVQSHKNLISALKSMFVALHIFFGDDMKPEDETYIAYLPLAHILEFLAENTLILMGVRVGFSSPFTLTDTGTMVKRGTKGDLSVLKPSIMTAVPVVLDKIYKGILAKVKAKGAFSYDLFDYAVRYNVQWKKRGYGTPILDRLIFKKVREATGGNLKWICAGGAPLSPTTHEFLRTVLGVELIQGYGLTETCATATLQGSGDLGLGQAGPALPRVDIKIRSWEEGNYTVKDPAGVRGEIIVGGDHVAEGYYEMPEQTAKDFEVEDGKRWFLTGDIGQVLPNGNVKIIDRKKDLVKLQMGEYVSLGKVETVLKLHHLVDNLCLCANPMQLNTVALVVPARDNFLSFCRDTLNKSGSSLDELVRDQTVLDAVVKALSDFGLSKGLLRFEIPRKIAIVTDDWTPDSGLVTAAMKIRRKQVDDKYSSVVAGLYKQLESAGKSVANGKSSMKAGGKINPV